jgi:anoctamin-10
LLSLEPIDILNRPYRIKDQSFKEVQIEELANRNEEKDKKNEDDEVEGIDLTSTDWRALVNAITMLETRNNSTFKQYLKAQQTVTDEMFKEMRSISSLKCLADRSLSVKPKEDFVVDREHMESYYVFIMLVKMLHKQFYKIYKDSKDAQETAIFKKYAGIMYRLIFQKAYGSTNKAYNEYYRSFWKKIFCCRWGSKKYVKDLWDRIEVTPLAPYSKYDPSHDIWRDYQINERKQRGHFRSMDRIKLLHNMLLDSINIYELQANHIIDSVMPLNDFYVLEGDEKLKLFEEFDEVQNFSDNNDLAEKRGIIFGMLYGMEDMSESSDFIDKPLEEKLKFHFYNPSQIDVEAIQNYFGEKVALYFSFLVYHTKRLYYIGIFGIIIFVLDIVMMRVVGFEVEKGRRFDANNMTSKDIALVVFKMNRVVLAIATVIWSSVYLEHWKRKQQYFAIKYGMTEFENNENKRPSFNGTFIRNLASSAFNVLHYPSAKRMVTTTITYMIVILIIIASIIISGACLLIRRLFKQGNSSIMLVYFFPAFINYTAVKIIEFFYNKLAMFFNMKENHETLTRFEDSLINKVFLFNFFNTFNSYFIIGFIKYIQTRTGVSLIFGECVNTKEEYAVHFSCYEELEGQTWAFFLLTFIFNFFEILYPIVVSWCKKKFYGVPRKYPWGRVDEIIEKEFNRLNYIAAPEIDGVLMDYSEVTIQFASLSFFGVVFPLAYILSYLTSVFEIHIDKLLYLKFIRRPVPRSAADIGNWQYILEAVSFFTIFVNAGLIVFTSEAFQEMNSIVFTNDRKKNIDVFSMQMKYYVFVVFVLLFIKLALNVLIKDTPDNLRQILLRHQHIIGRTIKKPRESNANGKSGFPIHPLPNQVTLITDTKKMQALANDDSPEGGDSPKSRSPKATIRAAQVVVGLQSPIALKPADGQ